MTIVGAGFEKQDSPPAEAIEPIVQLRASRASTVEHGTGFFIDVPGWAYLILTARHVLGGTPTGIEVGMRLTTGEWTTIQASAYAFDNIMLPSRDVGVVALYGNANVAGCAWGTSPNGTFDATIDGYPGSGSGGPMVTLACRATYHQPTPSSATFFTTDQPAPPGMSGGPLLTGEASLLSGTVGFGVVGMCIQDHLAIELPADLLSECAAFARAKAMETIG